MVVSTVKYKENNMVVLVLRMVMVWVVAQCCILVVWMGTVM